jgi:hypothetical protein
MIFNRTRIKRPPSAVSGMTSGLSGIKSEDDVLDIAKTMVPQTSAPKSVVPQSPIRPPAPSTAEGAPGPMFFGSSGSGVTRFDANSGRSVGATVPNAGRLADPRAAFDESSAAAQAERAAREERQARLDAAKDAARKTATENAREVADRVDYNRDGKIGGQDRPMTEEELINSIGRGFLEPIDNTQARGAADEALQQRNAENRANVRARLGVAGMGLSGAAGAAEGTEGRRGERERVLAMDEFDRGARKEQAERYLTGIGVSRESEVFKRLMKILDDEIDPVAGQLPNPDSNGDGVISPEEAAAARAAAETSNQTASTARNLEIEAMTQGQFESMTNTELKRLGWTVEGPFNDEPGKTSYFIWTSPSGAKKKSYIDDWDIGEMSSEGLEWG